MYRSQRVLSLEAQVTYNPRCHHLALHCVFAYRLPFYKHLNQFFYKTFEIAVEI